MSCATPPTTSSRTETIIQDANLVPREEACRALKYAQISRTSSPDLIAYVTALDAQWQSFCGEG